MRLTVLCTDLKPTLRAGSTLWLAIGVLGTGVDGDGGCKNRTTMGPGRDKGCCGARCACVASSIIRIERAGNGYCTVLYVLAGEDEEMHGEEGAVR